MRDWSSQIRMAGDRAPKVAVLATPGSRAKRSTRKRVA